MPKEPSCFLSHSPTHPYGAIRELPFNRENNCFYCLGTAFREMLFNWKNNCFYSLGTAIYELLFNRENHRSSSFWYGRIIVPRCLGTANCELLFNRENNRFYRLGTANCELPPEGSSFLIVLVAEKKFMDFPVGKNNCFNCFTEYCVNIYKSASSRSFWLYPVWIFMR